MIFFFPSFSNRPIFCEFPIGAYEALEIQKTGREMKGGSFLLAGKRRWKKKPRREVLSESWKWTKPGAHSKLGT